MSHKVTETADATIYAFELPKVAQDSSLVVQIRGKEVPVKATDFAKMILHTVKMLKAAAGKEERKKLEWSITEAAIIGQDASFTLMGVPAEAFKQLANDKKTNGKQQEGGR